MENHFFSEPVPFTILDGDKKSTDTTNPNLTLPTWKVIVYRRCNGTANGNNHSEVYDDDDNDNSNNNIDDEGNATSNIPGAIQVGVLYINDETLPPRKSTAKQNKNKVLWRLPDTYDVQPKFGQIEQARLWEIYKQQRKERRKKKIAGDVKNDENNDQQQKSNTSSEKIDDSKVRIEEYDIVSDQSYSVNNPTFDTTISYVSPTRTSTVLVPPPGLSPSPSLPPPGLSASSSSFSNPPVLSLPPPPGLAVSSASASYLPPPGLSPSSATIPPPGLSQPVPPPGFDQQRNNGQSIPQELSVNYTNGHGNHHLQKYFEIPHRLLKNPSEGSEITPAPPIFEVLGSIVANTFAHSIQNNLIHQNWLPYYYNGDTVGIELPSSSAARSTLLIGTATAMCTNDYDRFVQWKSLTQVGSIWEFHGFTSQPRVAVGRTIESPMLRSPSATINETTNDNNDMNSTSPNTKATNSSKKKKKKNGSSNNADNTNDLHHQANDPIKNAPVTSSVVDNIEDVFVVLTGKALQPQTGWFGYSLSLLLSSVSYDTPPDTARFAITNDVLTLIPLA